MNMVKVILGLEKIMGMVLMKEKKSNPTTNYGNHVRMTSINDGKFIRTIVVNGNYTMTIINNGKSTKTKIDNVKFAKTTR
jgi:ArsR family metal-binding transcriptional regulator